MKNSLLLFSVSGFVLGIFLRSLFGISLHVELLLGLFGISFLLLSFFVAKRNTQTFIFLSVVLVAVSLGMIRFDVKDTHVTNSFVEERVGMAVVAEGIVVDEPAQKDASQQLTVSLDTLNGEPVAEKVRVQTDRFSLFSYGDRIEVEGELSKPQSFETDAGRVFDYPAYLAKDDIYYQIIFADVSVLSVGNGNVIVASLFSLKHAFLQRLSASLPEPESSLAGGLLLGGKQSLGKELEDVFRTAGIVHIVVLSGYNITIVADAVMKMFSFLPRVFGMSAGALSILFFALMTGASATIVRASIMALIVVLARSTGRTYQISRALFVAGFCMLLQNPKILVFDPSFQLSFLATLGLIYVSPILEPKLVRVPERFHIREVVSATLSTQVTVLPLLLYQTGALSLVALPVNLFVLPFIPVTMFLVFITGVTGFVSSILALPFAYLAYLPLLYTISIAEFSARIPFASIPVPEIGGEVLVGIYALFAVGIVWYMKKKKDTAGAVSK